MAALCMAGTAVPAAAQAVPGASSTRPDVAPDRTRADLDAIVAFNARLGEALGIQVAAMKKLGEAMPLLESLATPAGVAAQGAKARAVVAEARSEVQRSDALLAGLVAPNLRMGTLSLAAMLAEARGNIAAGVALMNDYDTFVAALVRGDRVRAQKIAPKLLTGSYVLMDAMRSTYRNRQAAVPANQSLHQGVGVGAQLYRAMAASGRAWYNAALARQPDTAAATLRRELGEVAVEARALSRTGRTNLARELAEFDAVTKGLSGVQAEEAARFRAAFAGKARLFDVADEMATLSERGAAAASPAALTAQTSPALLREFIPIELRFHSAIAANAAAAGRPQ